MSNQNLKVINADLLDKFLVEQLDKETGAYSKGRNTGLRIAISAIRNPQIASTIDAAPVVHGRWERRKEGALLFWRCSACKNVHYLEPPNAAYCPGCGARMDEETPDAQT